LVNIIKEHARNRIVVGCVAWFSSRPVVDAIIQSGVTDAYFVVNDENYKTWGRGCAGPLYETLPSSGRSFDQIWGKKIETPLNVLDFSYQNSSVRAFGIRSYGKDEHSQHSDEGKSDFSGWGGTRSFMHSKYLVICDDNDMPRWVWIGSMNLTGNSSNNIETCVFLDDPKIALHCFLDFGMTYKDSKPLRFK
jgi:phosphatidylserine/phosphatidylglycerophosphate/cardiolipin synthase-like enzyme